LLYSAYGKAGNIVLLVTWFSVTKNKKIFAPLREAIWVEARVSS